MLGTLFLGGECVMLLIHKQLVLGTLYRFVWNLVTWEKDMHVCLLYIFLYFYVMQ